MNYTQIKHITADHYSKLKKYLKKIKENFNAESIHEFRLEYKKLRGFMRMLSQENSKVHGRKLSKKLNKTYHILGSIRELQLQRQKILEFTKYEPVKPRAYRFLLQKEIGSLRLELTENISGKFLEESKQKSSLPGKFSLNAFKNFADTKWADTTAIILSGHFSDDKIHSIRKNLKDLFYNLKAYEKAERKNLSLAVLKGKDEQYFDQLLDELGNFQDMCTVITLLKPAWLNSLNNNEAVLLRNIRQMRLRDKSGLKKKLVRKLRDDVMPKEPEQ